VRDQVQQVVELLRPSIVGDNGDISLRAVDESTGVVTIELTSSCDSCPSSTATLKAGIERIIKDRVSGVTSVEQVFLAPPEAETPVSL